MRLCILGWLLLACHMAGAQVNVTFHITKQPAYQRSSGIYVAGSFNNWKPADTAYRLQDTLITIQLPKGTVEYKFTRGSWSTVETDSKGDAIPNRKTTIEQDTTIEVTIEEWADHFTPDVKQSTASSQVHIMDTAFYIPQLDRYRRVWIYLPKGYATSRKKYDVMYMHDGQNVFDAATSFAGEWGVDETLDSLAPLYKETIVVAVDNGGDKRLNEYSPFDMPKFGRGEGDAYVDFLAHTLKPYIDSHYRTYKGHKHTTIAGSSMGGLISFYAVLKYPRIFGNAGVFSPAFWIAPGLERVIAARGKKVKGQIYFYAGNKESETMVPDMLAAFEQLHRLSKARMVTVIRADGRHSEANWREEFPIFYKWLIGVKSVP